MRWQHKASQINRYIHKHNKLNNSDNATMLLVFLLILILNQSYHQTHIAHKLTYIIAKVYYISFCYRFFFISSQLFFLCCMLNILRQMKKFLIELINRIPQFITQSIDWYDGLDEFIFFFLEKTAFDLPCFLFVTVWLILDTSGETTSWITFVCSLVCWD